MRLLAILAVAWAIIESSGANAQQYSMPLVPTYPLAGAYYDPDTGGTGWFISVGLKGELFAAHFTYQPDGTQTWVVLDDEFVQTPDLERLTTGVIGRVTGQLYKGANGQFIGGPKKTAVITASPLGQATLVWSNTDRATFLYNGVTTRLIRYHDFQVGSTPQKEISGTWRWHRVRLQTLAQAPVRGREFDSGVATIFPLSSANRKYFYYDKSTPAQFDIDDDSTAEQYQIRCYLQSINSGCPFGGIVRSNGDDNGTSFDYVIVRYPDGHFQAVNYVPSISRQDDINGQSITRYFVGADVFRTDLYIRSPQARQLVSRESFYGIGMNSLSTEVTFERLDDEVSPLEYFEQ